MTPQPGAAAASSAPSPLAGVARGIEALSKGATLASILLLLALRVTLLPGVPWSLRLLLLAALAAGWAAGRASGDAGQIALAFLAAVLPAVLGAVLGTADPIVYWAWMAALVGCLLPALRWSAWDLPPSWRVLLGGWALGLSLAWPVLLGRELGFGLQRANDVINANSWAGLPAPLVAGWIMHVVLVQLVGLLWLEWLLRRATDAPGDRLPAVVHGLWLGVTVSSLVAIYQGTVDLTFFSSVDWAERGRATGLMLDANSFGTVAALAAPVAVVAIRARASRHWGVLAAAVFAVNWAGVWMSGSRTAFLLGLVGSIALVPTLLRLGRPRARVLWPAAGAVALVVVLALSLSSVTDPLARLTRIQTFNDVDPLSALIFRGGYGDIAMQMTAEHPLVGVGEGTYNWLATDYQRMALDQDLPFDNAQNWWRHQLAELGLAGGLPVVLWSLLVIGRVFRRPRDAARSDGTTYRGLLLGLGLVSLVGMPTENPVALLWFFALVALLAGAGGRTGGMPGLSASVLRSAWVAVGVLAVVYAAGQAVLARGDLSVMARAARADRDYATGAYAEEPYPDGGWFRWTGRHAELNVAAGTRWLAVRTWVAHPDVAERPVELRLATPCQVLVERTLTDASPVDLALVLPAAGPVRLSVDVSRTWRPADYGGDDTRTLGAGLSIQYVDSDADAARAGELVTVTPCGAAATP